jgi:hypothetical protein
MATALKMLLLTRSDWGNDKGLLTGKVTFDGGFGEVSLKLDAEVSGKILALCAEGVIQAAKHTSQLMISEVLSPETIRIQG